MVEFSKIVEEARRRLKTRAVDIVDAPVFIPVQHMSDEEVAGIVEQAEHDPLVFDFLRKWLAGLLNGVPAPNPMPLALFGFMQQLLDGRIPPAGNTKREYRKEHLLDCRAQLIDRFRCNKTIALDAMAEAVGLSPETLRRTIYKSM